MIEGGHINHDGTGGSPFLFNQSGKFTGGGGWRFTHTVPFHRAKHTTIELDDRKLRARYRKMCSDPESYPIPKQKEE